MRLENATVVFRPRPAYEAMDLGVRAAQRWIGPILQSVALGPLCLFIAMWALHVWWGWTGYSVLLIMFWLRPLIGLVTLNVLSGLFFGARPGVLSAALFPFVDGRRACLHGLSLGRFSSCRTLVAPVRALEGLVGAQARERANGIARLDRGAALGLSSAAFIGQLGLWLGLVTVWSLLSDLGLPAGPSASLGEAAGGLWSGVPDWYLTLSFVISSVVFEVIHAAAGFALYINRRTHAEGWDIEITFRAIAQRLGGTARTALIALGITLAAVSSVRAEDPVAASAWDRNAREAIEAVMASEDFGGKGTRTSRRWREDLFRDSGGEQGRVEVPSLPGVAGLGAGAELFGWLVVVLAAAVVAYLIFRKGERGVWQGAFEEGLRRARGGDPRWDPVGPREPVVGDLRGRADQMLAQGRIDEAVAMLYRGAISALVQGRGLEISEAATEGEVQRLVRRRISASQAEYFQELTSAWSALAYAAHPLDAAQARRLVDGFPVLQEGR